jgi:hypothetical protein
MELHGPANLIAQHHGGGGVRFDVTLVFRRVFRVV